MKPYQVDRAVCHEHQPHEFSVEASDLCLAPGEWPPRLETKMGNGMSFMFRKFITKNGDLHAAIYEQANGCITLTVWND